MKKEAKKRIFEALFKPRSIAVVGASNDSLKPGGRVTKNILEAGYEGELWAVNPKGSPIMGLPTFKSIEELPAVPDLAIIAIPAPGVRAALEALALRGAKATIILTAGFGEKDEWGKKQEKVFLQIAEKAGMALVGPNCSGFLTPVYAGKFAGIIPRLKLGSVDFISGSGATVDYVMEQAVSRGLCFSTVVNLGNSIQMCVEDILELFDENYGPQISPIILLYMEQVKKPGKLLASARSLSRKGCTIIGVKSGVTEQGQRAAASHTGAIASSDTAVEALFRKAGIIRVRSKTELIDVACVLASRGDRISGNRACILTDAGGPGVMLSDELSRQGLVLPRLGERSLKKLSEILPPESSISNPIDCLPSRTAEQIAGIFKVLEEEKDNLDVVVVIVGNSGMSDNQAIYEEIARAMDSCEIPVVPVLSSVTTCASLIEEFTAGGHAYFLDEVAVGGALGKIVRRPVIRDPEEVSENYDRGRIKRILENAPAQVGVDAVKEILLAAGFKVPRQLEVYERESLEEACEEIGYPLVMKVIGPIHKSDVDGVRTAVGDREAAEEAWKTLMDIEDASGVLVQSMVSGTEVIMGAKREGDFGHLVMFGLGGIYTEALKDVAFALAPLAREEALNMVGEIRSFPLVQGTRGQKGLSLHLLADYLLRVGCLVRDFPQILEMDLNPVKGYGEDLFVVDARIIQRK